MDDRNASFTPATAGQAQDHPLDGCRLKLDRARHHLKAVHEGTHDKNRGGGLVVGMENHGGGNPWFVLRISIPEPFPDSLGVMFGEALNNIRSALDHLVNRLVELDGGEPTNRTGFPIYAERPADPRAWRRLDKAVEGLSDEHKRAILGLQPFEHPDADESALLTVLADLDNQSKHRLIVPCVAMREEMASSRIVFPGNERMEWRFGPVGVPLEDGDVICAWRADESVVEGEELTIHPPPLMIRIGFGSSVVTEPKMDSILARVSGIIESFADDFPNADAVRTSLRHAA